MRGAGAFFSMLLGLSVARLYGAEGAAVYYLFMSVLLGGALLARQGFDAAAMKLISICMHNDENAKAFGCWIYAQAVAFCCGLLLVAISYFCLKYFDVGLFGKDPTMVWCLSVSIPFFSAHVVNIGALRGYGFQGYALLVEVLTIALLTTLGVWVAYGLSIGGNHTPIIFYTVGILVAYVLGVVKILRLFHGEIVWPEAGAMRSVSLSFFIVGLTAYLIDWMSTYVLVAYRPVAEVGIYNTCFRLVVASSLIHMVFNNLNAPAFAVAFDNNDRKLAERVAQDGAEKCFLAGLAILIPVFFLAEEVLRVLGLEFVAGAGVMQVMIIGQLVNMFSGSVNYLLLMSGNNADLRWIAMLCLAIMVVLIVPVVKFHGMYGAALLWASICVIRSFLAIVVAKKKENILVVPRFLGSRLIKGRY